MSLLTEKLLDDSESEQRDIAMAELVVEVRQLRKDVDWLIAVAEASCDEEKPGDV